MKSVHRRLTYANVMSSIAVFLVVAGGSAFAAGQLGKNTVGTKQLKNDAVTAAKIKDGAVTGSKVALSSLGTVPNAAHSATADKAISADRAATADQAANSGHASDADHATNADRATTAGTADQATNATNAVNATNATSAQTAQNVATGAPGVALAAVNVEEDGTVVSWFNRLGGQPTVSLNGTGVYEIAIPGISISSFKEVIASATVKSSAGGLTATVSGGLQGRARVKTATGEGAATPEPFEFILYGATLVP
jgi:hypothetical protein